MTHDVKRQIRDHWNARAVGFDTSPSHGIIDADDRAEWKRMFDILAGAQPLKVLDVGTGTGEVALLLAELGHHVTGLDIAPDMLALARDKAARRGLDVTFVEGDAEAPPFAAASFDLVVNRHLLWTLPDPQAALAAWAGLLRPQGLMLVIDGDWGLPPAPLARIGRTLRRWLGTLPRPSLDVYRRRGVAASLPLQGKRRPAADIEILAGLGLVSEFWRIGPNGMFFTSQPYGRTWQGCRFVLRARTDA